MGRAVACQVSSCAFQGLWPPEILAGFCTPLNLLAADGHTPQSAQSVHLQCRLVFKDTDL